MTSQELDQYVHGTTEDEQRRLSALNDWLNERCLSELQLRQGDSVLDVGCGLGQFTRAMARAAGAGGRVIGFERDDRQRAEAMRQAKAAGEDGLVDWRQGDARAFPLRADEWATFDVAHARFVLEHVRDPLSVVRQMARAVKPGGRVVLADDDHAQLFMWPASAPVQGLWDAYMKTYERAGNDAFIGRRLTGLLHEAGVAPSRTTSVFFGGCAGSPLWPIVRANFEGVLRGSREIILAERLLDEASIDESLRAYSEWSSRPDAALWYVMCWAEGVVPARGGR